MSNGWSNPASDEVAAKRATGRARYNSVRKLAADLRPAQLIDLWRERVAAGDPGLFAFGTRAELARELGVSRATLTRDVQRLVNDLGSRRMSNLCRGVLRGLVRR